MFSAKEKRERAKAFRESTSWAEVVEKTGATQDALQHWQKKNGKWLGAEEMSRWSAMGRRSVVSAPHTSGGPVRDVQPEIVVPNTYEEFTEAFISHVVACKKSVQALRVQLGDKNARIVELEAIVKDLDHARRQAQNDLAAAQDLLEEQAVNGQGLRGKLIELLK